MGGGQSQPATNGGRTKNAVVGFDNNNEDGESSAPMHCFCLDGLTKNLRRQTGDSIGTPLPETPPFQRKRRQQVQDVLRQENPRMSSKYEGLEKESSFQSFNNGEDTQAGIHEGPDAETRLHDKYTLLEAIGVGSTSTVHRCVHKITNVEYACKVIDIQLIEERFAGMMVQFQTEIEALRQLKHPSIIRLYDVYLTGQKIFIIMELMEGGEIFDYVVQKGTLTEEEASKIVRKVTSALVYMHGNNICHRDLKPENCNVGIARLAQHSAAFQGTSSLSLRRFPSCPGHQH
jgi:tRNA A-37 threonylcarbamoyl transferase component Bud32